MCQVLCQLLEIKWDPGYPYLQEISSFKKNPGKQAKRQLIIHYNMLKKIIQKIC